MKMPRRSYSDDYKANALAALTVNGGKVKRTAKQLGIPRKTLAEWAKGRHVSSEVAKTRHQKERGLAEKFEELVHKLLDLMPGKMETASLSQLCVALGIATDKMLLLRKESSETNAPSQVSADDRRNFYARLGEALDPFPEAKAAVGRLLKFTSEHGRPPERFSETETVRLGTPGCFHQSCVTDQKRGENSKPRPREADGTESAQ